MDSKDCILPYFYRLVVEKNQMSYRERKERALCFSLVTEKREDEATFVETMLEMGFVLELLISRILCIFMFFIS
jgi:hypothetical protein